MKSGAFQSHVIKWCSSAFSDLQAFSSTSALHDFSSILFIVRGSGIYKGLRLDFSPILNVSRNPKAYIYVLPLGAVTMVEPMDIDESATVDAPRGVKRKATDFSVVTTPRRIKVSSSSNLGSNHL